MHDRKSKNATLSIPVSAGTKFELIVVNKRETYEKIIILWASIRCKFTFKNKAEINNTSREFVAKEFNSTGISIGADLTLGAKVIIQGVWKYFSLIEYW